MMRIAAAWCSTLQLVVTGTPQPAAWLGSCPSALYLQARSGQVLAVLSRDAVRLPCAMVVAQRATERPLSSLVGDRNAPDRGAPATIGNGMLSWNGPSGAITVLARAQWRPPTVPVGAPRLSAVARLADAVQAIDIGRSVDLVVEPDPQHLVGRGPGLTPSGDDVLAGYLIGTRAFGLDQRRLAAASQTEALAHRTTALSAGLLRHAAAGECVPQLARLVAALLTGRDVEDATTAVLRIGSSSGGALAAGLLIAARRAQVSKAAA